MMVHPPCLKLAQALAVAPEVCGLGPAPKSCPLVMPGSPFCRLPTYTAPQG